jgi:hypothetical protein
MAILVGMDEAGYGPNFGPLVVAATVWETADVALNCGANVRPGEAPCPAGDGTVTVSQPTARGATMLAAPRRAARKKAASRLLDEPDLYRMLRPVVGRSASDRRIAIADSKVLYKPGAGLRQLERGVHAALACVMHSFASWSALVDGCGADPDRHERHVPWHDGFDCPVPVDAQVDELSRLGERLARACDAAGVRVRAVRARLVFPARFNELVEYYGSKGAALSHVTVGLLREVIDLATAARQEPPAPSPQPPISIVCDKHGGRNYYTALLQHHFSDHWIKPIFESRGESVYEWGSAESPVRAAFRVGGESFLPTALASMTAKYLRELAMRAFNEFWCARVPNLEPTAGYPMDSHRFRKSIRAVQRELGMDDRILWRNR